jgi:hypothetical protein
MCVGITPPCSKCGAPARWRSIESSGKEAVKRITALAHYIETIGDDCPIKQNLKDIIEGRRDV